MEKFLKESNSKDCNANSTEMDKEPEEGGPNKRVKYGKSTVWNFFNKSKDGKSAKCFKCGKVYQTCGNTTNLSAHFKRMHPTLTIEELPTTSSSILSFIDKKYEAFYLQISNDKSLKACICKYLCVPATSTESERMFSKAGLIVSEKRSSLKSKNVDMLIFINKNEWISNN
ncbi:uncharacterized protein LOC115629041 [Scaptodrosophila lebanonensis]|uniref:Uncharacterized protein LOC115623277 n=1 Tax=Drosophila lebanonensis TaxID=7225 RepID=A0A6J2TBM8_DROLE|nr:uncharacterized protein LOC115623277 [Scaptodrosophila lebanonensis]XP_030381204.1 uncharacterized protein LOC115629041 [Scaptodrosophila lebanonensis]